jgi:hypothetical protein
VSRCDIPFLSNRVLASHKFPAEIEQGGEAYSTVIVLKLPARIRPQGHDRHKRSSKTAADMEFNFHFREHRKEHTVTEQSRDCSSIAQQSKYNHCLDI